MDLVGLVFGRQPRASQRAAPLKTAPPDAQWRYVRPRQGAASVSARLADKDGAIRSQSGVLRYRAGKHYIVARGGDAPSVVRRDLFERMYRQRPDGMFEKRCDVEYRYFTLAEPVTVMTLEGPQRAAPGDWIMQGLAGELWPIPAGEAETKYAPAA